jgi:predicted RecB family nuclease
MEQIGDVLRLAAHDLSNGHACGHSTNLDRRAALKQLARPHFHDPAAEALKRLGQKHEDDYLVSLRASGLDVIAVDVGAGAETAVAQTARLMREGAEVIYQAHLQHERWVGRADFLRRVPKPSALGAFSYEAVDTKLAAQTRAGTILQLCLYTELIQRIQDAQPDQMYVVTPDRDFEPIPYRVDDFAAYYRRARQSLLDRLEHPDQTYPEPVDHCDICRWWSHCDKQRRADDHVSLVAGITRSQRAELADHDIRSLEAFAESQPFKPRRGSRQSLEHRQSQAIVQLRGRRANAILHEPILPLEPKRGLNLLPEPNPGDVFVDLEGDSFVGRDGLEYLFGWVARDEGEWRYQSAWCRTAAEEKAGFDHFMKDLALRRAAHPELRIYHYAPYEPSAFKRLASRYAIHTELLDELLRGERFVDLYRVVKQGIRASVERYSIKDLEPLLGFNRKADLRDVRPHKQAVESLLQIGHHELPVDSCDVVEHYNEDDCRAALALRDWLESERTKLGGTGEKIERPTSEPGEASEKVTERAKRIEPWETALLRDLPLEASFRTAEQEARWLLAHMLQWHRRELNVAFWERYRMRELEAEELIDEPTALAGIRFQREIDKATYSRKLKSKVFRFQFDAQEAQLRPDDDLFTTGDAKKAGTILAIDHAAGWVDIKMPGARDAQGLESAAGVFKSKIVGCDTIEGSLERIADATVSAGCDLWSASPLAARLLHRVSPSWLPLELKNTWDVVNHLNGDVLPVQGPPGAGKSHSGARMILLLCAAGRKVGVSGTSHAVIETLMRAVAKASREEGVRMPRMVRGDDEGESDDEIVIQDSRDAIATLRAGDCDVLGGTVWLWSSIDAVSLVDTLFIDEAGQMSLTNAVACTPSTRNLVLLGDPQQLAQPTKASHPQGTEASALAHCLKDQQTISKDRGLFLEDTYRLHPAICSFISQLYYDNRLHHAAGRELQRVDGVPGLDGFGLRLELVDHHGNSNRSDEEVERVKALYARLLAPGGHWTNHEGEQHALTPDDVLIVAPYNAQVNALTDALPVGARVGTVDKFQGKEAAVVIYSMATSSSDDAPRGMDFLYDPHRLNVAVSRARALAIIVASPALLDPVVRSPKQMKLANALARFAELAGQ